MVPASPARLTRSSVAAPTTRTAPAAYGRRRPDETRPEPRRGTMTTATMQESLTPTAADDSERRSARLTRLLPLTGIVFAVLAMAGNLTIGDFPDIDTPVGKLTS